MYTCLDVPLPRPVVPLRPHLLILPVSSPRPPPLELIGREQVRLDSVLALGEGGGGNITGNDFFSQLLLLVLLVEPEASPINLLQRPITSSAAAARHSTVSQQNDGW